MSTEENRTNEMESLVENFKLEYSKFTEKGNKMAGTRARKHLQEIRNLAKDLRDEISKTKKEMATA
jgi:hypothetical protein